MRALIGRKLREVFREVDLLATPTMAIPAPPQDASTVTIGGELRFDSTSFPADFIVFADCEIRNFRARADIPAALTGSYEQYCADNRGSTGSLSIGVDLVDVTRGGATSTANQRTLRSMLEQASADYGRSSR